VSFNNGVGFLLQFSRMLIFLMIMVETINLFTANLRLVNLELTLGCFAFKTAG